MSFFDPRHRVREARIAENYHPRDGGEMSAGAELRCFVCGFFSRDLRTLAYVWERRSSEVQPPTIDLCDFCHQAASDERQ